MRLVILLNTMLIRLAIGGSNTPATTAIKPREQRTLDHILRFLILAEPEKETL